MSGVASMMMDVQRLHRPQQRDLSYFAHRLLVSGHAVPAYLGWFADPDCRFYAKTQLLEPEFSVGKVARSV
jgi:hypothetical protein